MNNLPPCPPAERWERLKKILPNEHDHDDEDLTVFSKQGWSGGPGLIFKVKPLGCSARCMRCAKRSAQTVCDLLVVDAWTTRPVHSPGMLQVLVICTQHRATENRQLLLFFTHVEPCTCCMWQTTFTKCLLLIVLNMSYVVKLTDRYLNMSYLYVIGLMFVSLTCWLWTQIQRPECHHEQIEESREGRHYAAFADGETMRRSLPTENNSHHHSFHSLHSGNCHVHGYFKMIRTECWAFGVLWH